MYEYEHTQAGTALRYIFGSIAIIMFALFTAMMPKEAMFVPFLLPSIFVVCLLLLHSLTVSVSHNEIELSFGIGLIRKSFAIVDIESVAIFRCRWYQKLCIQKIWHGWSYRVSGFDTVELHYKDGHKYRIGTDEPEKLLAAIEAVMGE